jgi:hypothetical protein
VTDYAVVAIPSKNDYVWKISSEKIPHLTLLYLGNQLSNVSRVTDFVEHVVKTSMTRFGIGVSNRDTLGPKDADVLFFDKNDYCIKNLINFRSYLLRDKNISTAYNQTAQYPIWTPHLTLGYPEAPAKPDNREYPGITWVNFDKIALWTSDYDGPEFALDDSYGSEAKMSVEEAVAHFGVKGMHWGQRKQRALAPRALGYTANQQQSDRVRFGNHGSDRINEHINNGKTVEAARIAEATRRRNKKLLILGATYATLMLATHGPHLAQDAANSYVGKKNAAARARTTANLLSDSRGIGNHKIVDIGYNSTTGLWG